MSSDTSEGYLRIITGGMFAGKTTELLRELFNEAAIGLNVLYINNERDTRSTSAFSTHNPLYREQLAERSNTTLISVKTLESLTGVVGKYDVIGIDEAQFFPDLLQVLHWVDDLHKKVIVAGLDGDYRREKFGSILDLLPKADDVVKLFAYCKTCSLKSPKVVKRAIFTKRLVESDDVILVGGEGAYRPVCRTCYLE